MDRVDDTIDAHAMLVDAEWMQIDTCIVSWLYTTISAELLLMVIQPNDNATIGSQILDNNVH